MSELIFRLGHTALISSAQYSCVVGSEKEADLRPGTNCNVIEDILWLLHTTSKALLLHCFSLSFHLYFFVQNLEEFSKIAESVG